MVGYKFAWNKPKLGRIKSNSKQDTLALGFGIANEAMRGAPILAGALVNSIRVTDDSGGTVYVIAGGSVGGKSVSYAKRREFENKKHPNKRFYTKNAFSWGNKNYQKYYKGVTR